MRAIVADDHPMIRQAVADLLRTHFDADAEIVCVGTYDGLFLAIDLDRGDGPPDLIVADLDMPDLSAFRNLAFLVRRAPGIPVLVYSSTSSAAVVRSVMQQGARGFVCKADTRENLVQAMLTVMSGGRYVGAAVAESEAPAPRATPLPDPSVSQVYSTSDAGAAGRPQLPSLTPRQREILRFVAIGLSNKLIARKLGISDSTVKVHMHSLFARLGVSNRTQAALLAREALNLRARDPAEEEPEPAVFRKRAV